MPALGRVAGLDVDQDVVDDHGGDREVVAAQQRRQPTQRVQVDPQLDVVDRGEQPLEVGLLVRQGRLGELRRSASAGPGAG